LVTHATTNFGNLHGLKLGAESADAVSPRPPAAINCGSSGGTFQPFYYSSSAALKFPRLLFLSSTFFRFILSIIFLVYE
jgi:hypothetical protein